MALDLAGVAVSERSHCSGKVGPSHVLAAMGFTPELTRCTIRVSLGWSSTAAGRQAVRRCLGHPARAPLGQAASPVPA